MLDNLLDRIIDSKKLIHAGLDAASIRHEVIANNIANVNTPGFKSRKVIFEAKLRDMIGQQGFDRNSLDQIRPTIVRNTITGIPRNDGNTVDLGREMSEAAKNAIGYQALLRLSSYRMAMTVIKGGNY